MTGTAVPDRTLTAEQLRWLDENATRMDLMSLSRTLGVPVATVEKALAERRAAPARTRAPETYRDAVLELSAARKEYEHAMDLLRRKELDQAAAELARLIERHPAHKEIVDRARIYLAAARSGKKAGAAGGADADALYREAVFEKNRGNHARALELLGRVNGTPDPDGRFRFLAACCYALTEKPEEALASLRAAVAASPENRIQARLSADLAALRGLPAFDEVLSAR